MMVEEGTGKRQRTRLYELLKMPGFEPADMAIKTEYRRLKTVAKLPGAVRTSVLRPADVPTAASYFQVFKSFDLAAEGDKEDVGLDGGTTGTFVNPLTVHYRDVAEVGLCWH
jgi:hypothetical protein